MVGVNISVICRRAVPAIGAACLVVGVVVVASPTAVADSPSVSMISGRDDDHPVPNYRPGPNGSNVPPPETSEKKPTTYYHSCDQARAEGKLRIYPGQPGWAPYLDRDGDGIACDE
jgi:hypothetical protein